MHVWRAGCQRAGAAAYAAVLIRTPERVVFARLPGCPTLVLLLLRLLMQAPTAEA
jgi:hypothetical protein